MTIAAKRYYNATLKKQNMSFINMSFVFERSIVANTKVQSCSLVFGLRFFFSEEERSCSQAVPSALPLRSWNFSFSNCLQRTATLHDFRGRAVIFGGRGWALLSESRYGLPTVL